MTLIYSKQNIGFNSDNNVYFAHIHAMSTFTLVAVTLLLWL